VQSTIKNRLFLQGLSENMNDDSFIDTRYPSVIVIDDLMRDATNSKDVCELFVDGSNHRNISVTCILHNGFSKGKENRTMSINTQYIVLFKNPRDQTDQPYLPGRCIPVIYSSTLPPTIFGEQLLLFGTLSNISVFNLSSAGVFCLRSINRYP
jgi:hypothetical protein